MSHNRTFTAASALIAAFVLTTVHAASLDAGHAKAKEACAACHGEDGNSATPDYPRLAGQHRDYLARALRHYKSGLRKNPIMAGFAGALSSDDIDNLAAYYSSQPSVLSSKH